MESIFAKLTEAGIDLPQFLRCAAVLVAGLLLLGTVSRFIFGKHSVLSGAVSSSVGILFIYAATVVVISLGLPVKSYLAPLPFASITSERMYFFSFTGAPYTIVCGQLVSMIILAFLVNLLDQWLPKKKNIFSWVFFRCLTIVGDILLHWFVTGLFTRFLPEGIVTYAPAILLGILILMLLTGALKLIVGLVLTTVNPLIAALYTFFFANMVGKQLFKAVLTTAILTGIVYLLNSLGVYSVSIASAALIAYIPFVVLLVALWYILCRIF